MLRQTVVTRVLHRGNDYKRNGLWRAVEHRMQMHCMFRDYWLYWTLDAAGRLNEPLAKSVPSSTILQRKLACYLYNQEGLMTFENQPLNRAMRWVEHERRGFECVLGSPDFMPFVNSHYWWAYKRVLMGHLKIHRVNRYGWGTDKTLVKGQWAHRWNKTMISNHLQYTRGH
jgi:hypothetical protein